jgi:hypothetical protein
MAGENEPTHHSPINFAKKIMLETSLFSAKLQKLVKFSR